MGKASKWFRSLLGLKKPDSSSSSPREDSTTRAKDKRRWSFVKSYREKDQSAHQRDTPRHQASSVSSLFDEDPDRHAVAVAAAKAAVAEKAVAAANAAVEAVRLMNSGRCAVTVDSLTAYGAGSRGGRDDFAALQIQSAFRGYLARRALRALKALVRLQALVRGHIRRKRMAKEAQWMQSMMRVQARARAGRAQISESSHSSGKSSHLHHHPGPPTPEKFEHAIRARSGKYEQSSMLKRIGSKSNGREIGDGVKTLASFNWSERLIEKSWEQRMPTSRTVSVDDEKSDKILEVDTVKPRFTPKQRRTLFRPSMHGLASDQYSYSFTTSKDSHQSASSGEVQSVAPLKNEEEEAYCTAENSPQFHSASSRGRSPFTPSKSDGGASFLSGYSDYYPSYMSYTESSKAKVRSLSAPKQRQPQYERSSSAKRYSTYGSGEPRSSSAQRSSSTLLVNFSSRAYPGSGHLDRLGMPIGQGYY